MKKLIIALLCVAIASFVFVSCTYGEQADTEKETLTQTEEESTESESQNETVDDGWYIETEESDDQPTINETDGQGTGGHETEESDTEPETDGNDTVGGDTEGDYENGETYPPADSENDGQWDPDVEEY